MQYTIPAGYDEVLTVTAMGDTDGLPGGFGPASCLDGQQDDVAAYFSNYATLPADAAHSIAAPGVCTVSTYKGAYGRGSGTSFAAPIVTGAVALCLASGSRPCAGLSPAQIVQKLVSDAALANTSDTGYGFAGDPLRPVTDRYYGNLISAASY
jgi:subtilisin family serine protease